MGASVQKERVCERVVNRVGDSECECVRLAGLESALERTKREDGAVREHITVLQKDFRDFAVNLSELTLYIYIYIHYVLAYIYKVIYNYI